MYIIRNSEKNTAKANAFETKSMLFLLSLFPEGNNVEIILVDVLNDITGRSKDGKLFDMQSKNYSKLVPSNFYPMFHTLFYNYISSINFADYILCIRNELNRKHLNENSINKKFISLNDYITDVFLKKVIKNLTEVIMKNNKFYEYRKVTEIVKIDKDICDFLSKVKIKIIPDDREIKYIQNMIDNDDIFKENIIKSVISEIENRHSSLKNSEIGKTNISNEEELLELKHRIIKRKEILELIFQRLLFFNFYDDNIPIHFIGYVSTLSHAELEEKISMSKDRIAKILFDKSNKKIFWEIFSKILELIKNNPTKDISGIMEIINIYEISKLKYLETNFDIAYFISIIKGVNKNESN